MTIHRDAYGNTRIIPDLEREEPVGEVRTSERGVIAVTVGWVGEQRCVRLQAFRRIDEPPGWTYSGRAVVLPVEKLGELQALLQKVEGQDRG